MALTDFLNINGVQQTEPSLEVLDFIFGRSAIVLNDVSKILGIGSGIPAPLLGFEYQPISKLDLLDFSYPEYPTLNRSSMINSYLKNNTRFSVRAIKPITYTNKFALNYLTNEAIYYALDKYVTAGGLFTILTPYCSLANCVLEKFTGVTTSDRDCGGQAFDFQFLKLNLPTKQMQTSQSNYLSSITSGVAF